MGDDNGNGAGRVAPPSDLLERSDRALRRLDLAVREAKRVLKALGQWSHMDVYGTFRVLPYEDELRIQDDLSEFLQDALVQCKGQELEIILVAHTPGKEASREEREHQYRASG